MDQSPQSLGRRAKAFMLELVEADLVRAKRGTRHASDYFHSCTTVTAPKEVHPQDHRHMEGSLVLAYRETFVVLEEYARQRVGRYQ